MDFVSLASNIDVLDTIKDIWTGSGIYNILFNFTGTGFKTLIMIIIACILLYLAIGRKFEPLLLVPIATGMLLANVGGGQIFNSACFAGGHVEWSFFKGTGAYVVEWSKLPGDIQEVLQCIPNGDIYLNGLHIGHLDASTVSLISESAENALENARMIIDPETFSMIGIEQYLTAGSYTLIKAGLFDYLYLGVKLGIYPCLIFMGVGAMTDFSPLIANPKSLILGAAAQLGIFVALFLATVAGMGGNVAASIGIIGGADGPTAILVTSMLAPEKLAPIAVAAYSYMALVPVIQPPIMRLLTTKKEREIVMEQLRPVSKKEQIVFPIAVAAIVILILPDTAPLIGSLMFGNLLRVCGVTERLSKTVQNELCNIVTIFLGTTVGATAMAESFLNIETLIIIGLGLIAFGFGTAGGVLLGKLMCLVTGGKINPLIGSAGVSAVPMAARVSQKEGQRANPKNFLLMHAMGPNVAGVIGSAVAAGVLLSIFG